MSRFKSPVVAAIASAALTASVVGGVAIAQTSGVITACVAENSGNVRIVSGPNDCKPNETSREWNQKGEKGDKGDPGTNGVNGTDGVSGLTRVTDSVFATPGAADYSIQCPIGTSVLSGGYHHLAPSDLEVTTSAPGLFMDKWSVRVVNTSSENKAVGLFAVCAIAK